MTIIHIGRKAPKGFEELPGGIHLGRGIWALRIRPINAAPQVPATPGVSVSQSAMPERSGPAGAAPDGKS